MSKNQGFSLIEMIVVVGIMGILAVAGLASYNKLNDRAQVEQAAQLLATELRVAQKRADSGVSKCAPGVEFGGVKVIYTTTAVTYKDVCAGLAIDPPIGTHLPANGTTLGSSGNFVFKTMSRGVDNGVSMVVTKRDISYTVTVNPAGGINVAKN